MFVRFPIRHLRYSYMRGVQKLSQMQYSPFGFQRLYNSVPRASFTKSNTIQAFSLKEMKNKLNKNLYAYSVLDICNSIESAELSEKDVFFVLFLKCVEILFFKVVN